MATQWTAGLTDGTPLPAATLNTIGAAWENWTPQLWQGANRTSTVNYCRYAQINKLVVVVGSISPTATGSAGSAIEIRSLPITMANQDAVFGSFSYLDAGVAWYIGSVVGASTTSVQFYGYNTATFFGGSPNFAVASGDAFRFGFVYEAA